MSLSDKIKQDEKSELAQKSEGWFKFKEGKNSIRILSEPMVIYEDYVKGICFTDCGFKGNIKYMAYVIDNVDLGIKKMKIPYGIFQYIADLEDDEDWQFQGFPMPYDLNINATNAGVKEVNYDVKPRPVRTEIPDEIKIALAKKKPIVEVIEDLKKKNKEKHIAEGRFNAMGATTAKTAPSHEGSDRIEYPVEDINPEDIPF